MEIIIKLFKITTNEIIKSKINNINPLIKYKYNLSNYFINYIYLVLNIIKIENILKKLDIKNIVNHKLIILEYNTFLSCPPKIAIPNGFSITRSYLFI